MAGEMAGKDSSINLKAFYFMISREICLPSLYVIRYILAESLTRTALNIVSLGDSMEYESGIMPVSKYFPDLLNSFPINGTAKMVDKNCDRVMSIKIVKNIKICCLYHFLVIGSKNTTLTIRNGRAIFI